MLLSVLQNSPRPPLDLPHSLNISLETGETFLGEVQTSVHTVLGHPLESTNIDNMYFPIWRLREPSDIQKKTLQVTQ